MFLSNHDRKILVKFVLRVEVGGGRDDRGGKFSFSHLQAKIHRALVLSLCRDSVAKKIFMTAYFSFHLLLFALRFSRTFVCFVLFSSFVCGEKET